MQTQERFSKISQSQTDKSCDNDDMCGLSSSFNRLHLSQPSTTQREEESKETSQKLTYESSDSNTLCLSTSFSREEKYMHMNSSSRKYVMARPNDDIAISRQSSTLTTSNISYSLDSTDVSLDTLHRTIDRKPFEQRAVGLSDSSSESDFDYNEEINMDDFDFNYSLFDWKAPPTPQFHNRWELY